jgi:hypothetical protein|tara:strand:- start:250 stop:405 length:156 start_codon:yes stop_codon:yes gene_type:complete
MMIKPINPIAKAMAHNRRRKQVVPNKKKYNRKTDNTFKQQLKKEESKNERS